MHIKIARLIKKSQRVRVRWFFYIIVLTINILIRLIILLQTYHEINIDLLADL